MQSADTQRRLTYILLAGAVAAIFAIDTFTKLGIAEWLLYLVPLALCLFQPRADVPLLMAAAATIMTGLGIFLSPPGSDVWIALLNRLMGLVAMWTVALLVARTLRDRQADQVELWVNGGEAQLSQALVGEQNRAEVAEAALSTLARYLGASVGVLYRLEGQALLRTATYSCDPAAMPPERLDLGQGLSGQAARDGELQLIDPLPEHYLKVSSALGQGAPRSLLIAPMKADRRVVAVIELGFVSATANGDAIRQLALKIADPIGAALRSALYRERLVELLEETQRQSEELQAQQEELRVSNEELEEQSRALQESQARLEVQQAELEQTNVQLEEQTQRLERQKEDLLVVKRALEMNAQQLETANRHKSEFLANMSHELRTPLNSALILSKLLADNKLGHLDAEEVRYAQSIHAANNDLLTLINDILDLSRIEAGHVEVHAEAVGVDGLVQRLNDTFSPIAQNKGLAFRIETADTAPATLLTDAQRLQQVLKNLLSNALKFTERGEVVLSIGARAPGRVGFAVRDTGIGIAPHQRDVIFEAFRQADGSTSRKYGGTGLGLSISKELAHLLGGEILLDSTPGQGSTFTLDIPVAWQPPVEGQARPGPPPAPVPQRLAPAPAPEPVLPLPGPVPAPRPVPQDDRGRRTRAHRLILVIEDDVRFAQVLYDMAHELDFDCVMAHHGAEGLQLARELQPSGILLDIGLPDQSGLGVLEQLKRDSLTRHIPVHMISLHDRAHTALELGAIGYALKPVGRDDVVGAIRKIEDKLQQQVRQVLVVEDDPGLRDNLKLLLSTGQAHITTVGTVKEALEQLAGQTFDCMVTDLALPDGTGFDLLSQMATGDNYAFPPVIVYTGRELTADEEQRLRRYSRSIIIKGARSPDRLLDEVTLFLHSVESALPPDQQRLLKQARQRDVVLDGRTILLAEDDVRNVFALSSVLEPLGATLRIARNGREALQRLGDGNDVDLVLMDIMMPEMDGLSAIRELRARPELAKLPVIALTAKAMPDDRVRCIEAGADDYIAKPIDVDRLVSLCRVWIRK
ncbi:response regulator [Caldimonas brevitalea]|uniref:Virulence sensor protein BvgS n=1 Tax=Caldimonas brevitalea TaxID=413882 RepID=A0A0G3BKE1_9BURK|nr:response regulator [Caldimonas brevitalea]AKJ29847.1 histidine kinase [Caldimonas brevitalea]